MSKSDRATEPAWSTYLFTGIILIPVLGVWLFSGFMLVPKVQLIWDQAGTYGNRPDFLLTMLDVLYHHFWFILGGIVLLLFICETKWTLWKTKLRKPVLYTLTAFFTVWVCVGIATLSTTAIVAAGVIEARASQ